MTGLDIAQVRPVIESEIERLIGLLDMLEPDPDFEDGADLEEDLADDEPLLGAPNQSAGSWKGIDASFGCDDGEELELGWTEQEARWNRYSGAGADVSEPSLGSTHGINQNSWSKGGTDDLEAEFDGREIETDFEPIDEREPFGEGSACYGGPCSPITTMVGRPPQLGIKAARMATLSTGNPNMGAKSPIACEQAIAISQREAAKVLNISQGNVLEFPRL